MGKLTTIRTEEPNAVLVKGGYFPLPLQMVGPDTWRTILSANYGVSPINRTPLKKPTFGQVAELAGVALTDRYNHRNDKGYNHSLNPVISSINDGNKVLTADTLWVIVQDKKLYVVNHPDAELSAQFGVNNQEVLERLVAGFDAQLGKREAQGISTIGNIASLSLSNVSQRDQSRDSKADNYLGKNLGLIASVGSRDVAKSLAVGSNVYVQEPYFSLNGEAGRMVTRVPFLLAFGFGGRLCVYGLRGAVDDSWCSFGYSESGEATRVKK